MADKDFEQKAFNYTLEGIADEVGIIARGSAANPDNNGLNSKKEKEKKQREFIRTLNELQKWLDKEIERLENSVKDLKIKIEATQRLFDAYIEGQRSFDSPLYTSLIQVSGIDQNTIKNFDASDFEHYLSKLKNDLDKNIEKLQKLKDLRANPGFAKKQELQAAIISEGFTDKNIRDAIAGIYAKADTDFDFSSFGQEEKKVSRDHLIFTKIDPGFQSKEHFLAVAGTPKIKEDVEFEAKKSVLDNKPPKIH